MLESKFREALICLKNPRVTLPYPAQPAIPADGFRGRLDVDVNKCIGCGACANVCPARLISLIDTEISRTVYFALGRCTYCARCAEVCPVDAIAMTKEFELATTDKSDLNISVALIMAKCEECATPFTTQRIVDLLKAQLTKEIELEPAVLEWLEFCPNCRKVREGQKISEAGA